MSANPRQIPDQAARCLACACGNPANLSARTLLVRSRAQSSTGVLAAMFVGGEQAEELTRFARRAISEQREWCSEHGPFDRDSCTIDWILNRG